MENENKKLGSEPAFPTEVGFENGNHSQAHFSGMSKRFYRAKKAIKKAQP